MDFRDSVMSSQQQLNIISKNDNSLLVKAKYGPSKETKIPLILNEKLSFFVATVIGDGHIKKDKLQIVIELTNYKLLKEITNIVKDLFDREIKIHTRASELNRRESFVIYIDGKAIYELLNKSFGISRGKKCDIVNIPHFIKKSDNSIKSAFLLGIMVTEGGNRRRGYGLSTASKKLRDDSFEMIKEMGIKVSKDEWTHKKYKKKYYGLAYKKEEIRMLSINCIDDSVKNILKKCPNFCLDKI
jgi:DNA-binding transcriptional regulator WhiA